MGKMTLMGALKNSLAPRTKTLSSGPHSGGWRTIFEPYTGAWQRNDEIKAADLGSFFAIYSCITLIAGDISKLRARIMATGSDGIQAEQATPSALKRPNRYQNHIQFKQWWSTSKLSQGNAYGLKQRDRTGKVEAIYILDPCRVRPMVADDGGVYYELATDTLNGVPDVTVTVPASEIIHDRYQPQHHPLIGVSPIAAAALSGKLGLRIQQDSQTFFGNGARPGGILVAPGAISDDTANRLKQHWNDNYSGANSGKVAVLGDGLKFEPMRATSVDSQLVEQLKLSAEVVCSCFHVPPFKIGFGTLPSGKVEEMNLIYYSDCLQVLIEEFEQCMTDGLSLPERHSVELDIDSLWRMDTESKFRMLSEAIKGVMAPNEARRRVNLKPVGGGDSVYMQQQNFSLEALAKRDAQDDPFGKGQPEPAPPAADDEETKRMQAELWMLKSLNATREAMHDYPVEFGKQMAAIVREATAPLVERISELEKALSDIPRGIDVDAVAKSAADLIPAPADPEIDVDAIAKAAAELIPAPKDGADADMNALKSHLEDLVKAIPAPKDGADGKDADMAELKLHLAELVKHVQLPSVDEVAAVFERRFSDLTLSWERQARDTFEKAVDRMPKPKDGRDALPLESFDLSLAEDGRTVTVKMQAGDTVLEKSLKIASVIDRGAYKSQSEYECGDAVTHGGSLWIAQKDAPEGAPGMGGKGWRLAVKKGRDGKDLRDNSSSVDKSKGVKIA